MRPFKSAVSGEETAIRMHVYARMAELVDALV